MTDVNGNRSLPPSKQQPYQDYYLRVVEDRRDGIVVREGLRRILVSPTCQ
jgi:aromatic ring hydroxylase